MVTKTALHSILTTTKINKNTTTASPNRKELVPAKSSISFKRNIGKTHHSLKEPSTTSSITTRKKLDHSLKEPLTTIKQKRGDAHIKVPATQIKKPPLLLNKARILVKPKAENRVSATTMNKTVLLRDNATNKVRNTKKQVPTTKNKVPPRVLTTSNKKLEVSLKRQRTTTQVKESTIPITRKVVKKTKPNTKPVKSPTMKNKPVIPLKTKTPVHITNKKVGNNKPSSPVIKEPLIEETNAEYSQDTFFMYDYMEQCKIISHNITAYELTVLKDLTCELTLLTNKNDILYKLFNELNNTIKELSKILEPLSTKRIFREFHNAVIAYTNIDGKVNLTMEELVASRKSTVEKEGMLITYLNKKLKTNDTNN